MIAKLSYMKPTSSAITQIKGRNIRLRGETRTKLICSLTTESASSFYLPLHTP